jgi:hypothetical protein
MSFRLFAASIAHRHTFEHTEIYLFSFSHFFHSSIWSLSNIQVRILRYLKLIIDATKTRLNAREQAMAYAAKNKVAFARRIQRPITNHTLSPARPSRPIRTITYRPMEREAQKRKQELESRLFGLIGSYTEYGSTEGGWREKVGGRRYVLPAGCSPRRSTRFIKRDNTILI